jgi:hypothetical protein
MIEAVEISAIKYLNRDFVVRRCSVFGRTDVLNIDRNQNGFVSGRK